MLMGTTIASLSSDALNLAQVGEVSQYFQRLRIFSSAASASNIAYQKQQALYAKAAGNYVIFGCTPNTTVTASYWNNTYVALALELAAWAEANGMDEFSLANEEELRIDGVTIIDPYALVALYYKPLATQIRAVFSGEISFCISNGAEPWIENITPGDITKVGFNAYGDYSAGLGRCDPATFITRIGNLKSYANWADIAYMSEFNVDFSSTRFNTIAQDDNALEIEMGQKLKAIEDAGYEEAYPFCWIYAAGSQWFSMKKTDGSYREFMQVMSSVNKRPFLITPH